ncbi:MAG: hypothetical protein CVU44_15125 [Chloroflexi bacterium HGW-Chloroflexi-6]|nr:MAG: hypothetical protein CVU44_15125 [Chloroflexi bacterium HGW-Chloroflexi-6]
MLKNIRHSFIVRIWVEPRENADEQTAWRGMVQHVVSGEQTYFQTFEEMVAFMKQSMDLNLPGMRNMEQ